MRIYLDLCVIQRPFDDQMQPRVRLETQALIEIVARIQTGSIELVSSTALLAEHQRNRHLLRKTAAGHVLALASEIVPIDPRIESRAELYRQSGLKEMDAVHLACAVELGVDYFCTCDDRLLRRARTVDTGLTRPVTPLELMEEVDQ
jgi:predicted nucleic acid-binding protein